MVPPSEGSTKKKNKRTTSKKKKNTKKVCSSAKTSVPNTEDDKVEPRNPDQEPKDYESKPSKNSGPHVKPSLITSPP
ncbi:hypothetical protein P8452_27091 [Trifolium repens]|nr:hypothetical protein P8452_27091 [Trifolium repens]